jgi:hypothetical protein
MLENFSTFSEAEPTGVVIKMFFARPNNSICSNRNLLGLLFHQRMLATCVLMTSKLSQDLMALPVTSRN